LTVPITGLVQAEECIDALTVKSSPTISATDKVVPFTSAGSVAPVVPGSLSSGYESYFSITNPTRCPVTSCRLLTYGAKCGSALPISTNNWFAAATTPFAISTYSNQIAGKTSSVCYECSNKHKTLTVQITELVQESKCKQTLVSDPVDLALAPSYNKLYKDT